MEATAGSIAVLLCLLSALLLTPSRASWGHGLFPLAIHPLRPLTGSGGHPLAGFSCASWRLGVETNNVRGWQTVPAECEGYMGHYMLGNRYRLDSAVVIAEAIKYAESLKLCGDGKDVWVFDIDETSLSNLPYYAHHGFGVEPFNVTSSNEWVLTATAPALPESLKLYKKLQTLGIKIVFLTGRPEDQRKATALNLRRAGYKSWEKLLLKGKDVKGTAVAYKSGERQKLVEAGYRIVGNIGDQWSDILGYQEGARTFKLPDPMYYLS